MPAELQPVIGNWYQAPGGDPFEVVALDDAEGTVEVQYFGGEIDEISRDIWKELELEESAAPEDWSGPFDDLEPDDLGGAVSRPEDWGGPWDEIDKFE